VTGRESNGEGEGGNFFSKVVKLLFERNPTIPTLKIINLREVGGGCNSPPPLPVFVVKFSMAHFLFVRP
jgi:hypothetical protein